MKKLTSRKFWIAVALMGYGAIMGIRNANIGNDKVVTIVYTIGVIAVGIGYIFAEAMCDKEDEIEEGSED